MTTKNQKEVASLGHTWFCYDFINAHFQVGLEYYISPTHRIKGKGDSKESTANKLNAYTIHHWGSVSPWILAFHQAPRITSWQVTEGTEQVQKKKRRRRGETEKKHHTKHLQINWKPDSMFPFPQKIPKKISQTDFPPSLKRSYLTVNLCTQNPKGHCWRWDNRAGWWQSMPTWRHLHLHI